VALVPVTGQGRGPAGPRSSIVAHGLPYAALPWGPGPVPVVRVAAVLGDQRQEGRTVRSMPGYREEDGTGGNAPA